TNSYDNTVSVLLNTTAPGATAPTFAPRQDFATGATPWTGEQIVNSVALGDVNGDGPPDLISFNVLDHTVSVLLNTTAPGDSSLSFASHQDFAIGTNSKSVALGDVNGDGRPDLVVVNQDPALSSVPHADSVSVLLNTTAAGATSAAFAAHQDFAT